MTLPGPWGHRGLFRSDPVELQADDTRDCLCEGREWSAVVGVQDSPSLQVRDHLFDNPAYLVDLLVVFLLPLFEFPSWGFLVRSNHFAADVALVTDPVSGIEGDENLG